MAFQIKFAGVTIDGVDRWAESRPAKLPGLTFPRRHGALVQEAAFSGPRIVNLSGEVSKDSEALLQSYLDDLGAALFEAGRNKLYLKDNTRYLNAICSATGFPEYDAARRPADTARFSI